jgi:hypothetical protein
VFALIQEAALSAQHAAHAPIRLIHPEGVHGAAEGLALRRGRWSQLGRGRQRRRDLFQSAGSECNFFNYSYTIS